jgi:hypothetical protein
MVVRDPVDGKDVQIVESRGTGNEKDIVVLIHGQGGIKLHLFPQIIPHH